MRIDGGIDPASLFFRKAGQGPQRKLWGKYTPVSLSDYLLCFNNIYSIESISEQEESRRSVFAGV
jgi:hypothetical protein